jgi:hypothetical protein
MIDVKRAVLDPEPRRDRPVSDPGDEPVVVSEVLVDCPYCKRINTVSIVNDGDPHYAVCAQCDVAFAVTVRSVDAIVQRVVLVEE